MTRRSPSSSRPCIAAAIVSSRRSRPMPAAIRAAGRSRPSQSDAATFAPARLRLRPWHGRARRVARSSRLVAAVVLLALGRTLGLDAAAPVRRRAVVRVNVAFPAEQAPVPSLNAHPIVTLSPDGQRFVYVGGAPDNARLFLREMNRFDAVPLPGHGRRARSVLLARWRLGRLLCPGQLSRKCGSRATSAPTPQVLCATETGCRRHMGVGERDRVRAELARSADARHRVGRAARLPSPCPRARRIAGPTGSTIRPILATRWRSSADDAAVVAISLSSGVERVIAEPATFGRYAPGGYVLFVREGDLYAVRRGPSGASPQGTPVRVVSSVMTGMTGAAQFAISPRGSLLYIEDIPERSQRTARARRRPRQHAVISLFRRAPSTTSPRAATASQPRSSRAARPSSGPGTSIAPP